MKNYALHPNLHYLYKKPKQVFWNIVAGPPGYKLTVLQDHDLIFDEKDAKMRQLDWKSL